MTAEQFLAWEQTQPERHQWYAGEVFAMAGGSPRHNALSAAVIGDLRVAVRGSGCRVLSSDQRLALPPGEHFVYPDALVVCGAIALLEGTSDVIVNPAIVVEVLSPSTELYDRGAKWDGYRRLPSLVDYLLVAQDTVRIEHYQRRADGSWRYGVVEAGGQLTLTRNLTLDLDTLYDGVFDLTANRP